MRFVRNLFRNKKRDKELPQLLDGNDYPDFWTQIEGFKKFAETVNQGAGGQRRRFQRGGVAGPA